MRILLGCLLATWVAAAGPGAAQERGHDIDAARGAVVRGEAMPLAELLDKIRPSLPGQLVGVELEREDGRWIYELKVVAPDGRRREVKVDARTGALLTGSRR